MIFISTIATATTTSAAFRPPYSPHHSQIGMNATASWWRRQTWPTWRKSNTCSTMPAKAARSANPLFVVLDQKRIPRPGLRDFITVHLNCIRAW